MNHQQNIDTGIEKFTIRFADQADVPLILYFIQQLAEYENLSDEVVATEEGLRESLFEQRHAEVIVGEYDDQPVAFALFFHNYSTFLGKAGIYLEDLYVHPDMRGKGIGKSMLAYLAKLAVERNCGRLEWSCLDWNQPSIQFYKKLGAVPMDEWTVYRVDRANLRALADSFGEQQVRKQAKEGIS